MFWMLRHISKFWYLQGHLVCHFAWRQASQWS